MRDRHTWRKEIQFLKLPFNSQYRFIKMIFFDHTTNKMNYVTFENALTRSKYVPLNVSLEFFHQTQFWEKNVIQFCKMNSLFVRNSHGDVEIILCFSGNFNFLKTHQLNLSIYWVVRYFMIWSRRIASFIIININVVGNSLLLVKRYFYFLRQF